MSYDEVNRKKQNFDSVYNEASPAQYFLAMRELAYEIPESSKATTDAIIMHLLNSCDCDHLNILDIGCSYGVNASVIKCGVPLQTLFNRYDDKEDRSDQIRRDQEFYSSIPRRSELNFIGFDSANNAVDYAKEIGILAGAFSGNFENATGGDNPFLTNPNAAQNIDMILSTGCVGYVTERTFAGILDQPESARPKIVASYVLRMFDYGPIARCLADRDYETKRLVGQHFRQRRCANQGERDLVLSQVTEHGLNPYTDEVDGYLCADLYLSWRSDIQPPLEKR